MLGIYILLIPNSRKSLRTFLFYSNRNFYHDLLLNKWNKIIYQLKICKKGRSLFTPKYYYNYGPKILFRSAELQGFKTEKRAEAFQNLRAVAPTSYNFNLSLTHLLSLPNCPLQKETNDELSKQIIRNVSATDSLKKEIYE